MADEVIIPIDTGEIDAANSSATEAAREANEAAVSARAAASNQAEIISDVTAYAREDADRARAEADNAAQVATDAANATVTAKDEILAAVSLMLEELRTEFQNNQAPVVVQSNEPQVSEINPAETEEGQQEENLETEETPPAKSRKRHGRRRR